MLYILINSEIIEIRKRQFSLPYFGRVMNQTALFQSFELPESEQPGNRGTMGLCSNYPLIKEFEEWLNTEETSRPYC